MTTNPTPKHQQEARELIAEPWPTDELMNRVATALSSRDQEIREVLEGLRRIRRDAAPCWCAMPAHDSHDNACLAARGLWERVNLTEPTE